MPVTHLPPERKNFLSATSRLAITKLKRPKFSRPRREAPGSRFHVTFHKFGGQSTSRPRRDPSALSDLQAAAWAGVRTLGEHCYQCLTYDTAFVSRAYSEGLSELRLWHERLGHLNLAAVCRLLGVPLPPKPFFCKGCVAGKSTRQSFKHLEWAPHFQSPRAAHTFHSDVAGPYTPTFEGYICTIFFVCGFSRFIFPKLVKTTSEYTPSWITLVNQQEAQAGSSRVVAVLHSDGAAYMDSLEIREFN